MVIKAISINNQLREEVRTAFCEYCMHDGNSIYKGKAGVSFPYVPAIFSIFSKQFTQGTSHEQVKPF